MPQNLPLADGPDLASRLARSVRRFTPSESSSQMSQYNPSTGGSEDQRKLMADVSGISTPMGTPRAAQRDLDGSSVRGEGSAIGETDAEDLQQRLSGLMMEHDGSNQGAARRSFSNEIAEDEPSRNSSSDPNLAPDLDDLKAGNLETGDQEPHRFANQRDHLQSETAPINAIAGSALKQNVAEHNIPPDQVKHQSGHGGEQIEEVEHPDEIEEPRSKSEIYDDDDALHVREATPSSANSRGMPPPESPLFQMEEGEGRSEERVLKGDGGMDGFEAASADQRSETEMRHAHNPTHDDNERPAGEAPILPSVPSRNPNDTEAVHHLHKPYQLHIEPAPIAQPANEADDPIDDDQPQPTTTVENGNEDSDMQDTAVPSFPDPPHTLLPPPDRSSASTPLDPSFAKSFPDVPDESKPRVEIHVSSPARQISNPHESTPATMPVDTAEGLRSPKDEEEVSNGERRWSRSSPRSPLLNDEDPGDEDGAEGWAIVTK